MSQDDMHSSGAGAQTEARAYVLANFDRALREGHIKVSFQPIVRSFTKKFCNSEALARWEAPDFDGSLRPDFFVRVLEEAHLVHKLDLFVLVEVARVLRYELDNDVPAVPISVNFSRLDFILADIPEAVARVVKEYGLPPHLICIEITETALIDDPAPLREAINTLRDAGFQVWLDDFGSGYSSLNVLKDFGLDEVKLDIEFLRNYGEQSKRAIAAIVSMAHKLGLHTLAEGVETAEQAEFLVSIGCEKMQGYFFARPMYLDAAVDYPQQRAIAVETPREERLFTGMKPVNMISDDALSLTLYDSEAYRIVYANAAYRQGIRVVGFRSLEYLNDHLSSDPEPAYERYRRTAQATIRDGRSAVIFFEGGRYMRLAMESLSQTDGMALLKARLIELDRDTLDNLTLFDRQARNFMSLYDGVYYVRSKEERVEVIRSVMPEYTAGDTLPFDREAIGEFGARWVHPRDRARFERFMQVGHLTELAEVSPRNEAASMFRMRRPDGSYRWMVFDAMLLDNETEGDLLIAARENPLSNMDELGEILDEYGRGSEPRDTDAVPTPREPSPGN